MNTPNYEVQEVSPSKRRIRVEVSAEEVTQAWETAVQAVQREAKLDGFRQGKVPRPLLEKHFGEALRQEAVEAVVRQSFPAAVESTKLEPLARPQITPGTFLHGSAFSYEATFEVRPHVVAEGYKALALSRPAITIAETDVQAQLERFREAMTQLVATAPEATAAVGMVARIDFEGTVDGKSFEGGAGKDVVVDIGSGSLMADFEAQLVGMKVGEQRTLTLTYPADYFNVSLAGSTATFAVTLRDLRTKVVPELSDEFAKDLGNYQTLEEVRIEVRRQLEEQNTAETRATLVQQIMEQLLKRHTIEVPETMVMWELSQMYRQFEQRMAQEKTTWEQLGITPEQFVERYGPVARDRVCGTLLLDAIAAQEQLGVTEEEVEAQLRRVHQGSAEDFAQKRRWYDERGVTTAVRDDLLHQKCLDFVIRQATITDVAPTESVAQ